MNSLNILSSRVIGQASSISRPRSRSQAEILSPQQAEDLLRGRSFSEKDIAHLDRLADRSSSAAVRSEDPPDQSYSSDEEDDEKSPLLEKNGIQGPLSYKSRLRRLVKRIADALTALLSTIGAPALCVVRCFQDEDGRYSPWIPVKRLRQSIAGRGSDSPPASTLGTQNTPTNKPRESDKSLGNRVHQPSKLRNSSSSESLLPTTSESETEKRGVKQNATRARPGPSNDENAPARRSIRIKLNNSDSFIERKQRKSRKSAVASNSADAPSPTLTVDNIKSPTSPSQSLKITKYPHAPAPPRPLIPRRQPSYSNLIPRSLSYRPQNQQQKTLVIDLDETLIHSLAKGGRMSSGHMVEVKLNAPVALSPVFSTSPSQSTILRPQHPILYYVHKRPHCDEFLRKICKWFKLVVFTASVQEYADPVIDWLEQERKYFTGGRYYRQHCTFRNGAYIKDLSSVEPDLSKVMILDNSPMSYIFHEDNAIPIEGWINDPTDNDLLHLIPLLEALQYVTDVRALLALRRGEADS